MRWVFRRSDRRAGELARINAALQEQKDELARAEQERDRFFELSVDLLCIAGFDGYFKQLNPAWETTLGFTREELMARPYIELIHPEDVERTAREATDLRRASVGKRVIDFENRYRTRDGGYRWLSWRVTSVPEARLIYGAARDVDERKKIEQMKGEFLSVVSHELRTPLTSIRGALGLLAGGVAGALPAEARGLLDIAANNSERLVRLINDILDMEKIESGKMLFRLAAVDLMSLVEQAVAVNSTFADFYGVEIRIVKTCPGVQVQADPDRLQQVLANLLSNAAKFSPRGGTVEVGVVCRGERVCVSVTDRGPGIPAEFHPRVFERFAQADASTTRRQGGTGLGLSISKAIVERHQGRIWFRSEPEAGTTFFFDLPVWVPTGELPVPARATVRVLVCEDEPDVARLLHVEDDADLQRVVAAIVGADATVESAGGLEEARRKLAGGRFDLVLLDLALPDGSGLELLPLLNEVEPRTPVIIFSAREVDQEVARQVAAVLIKSQTTNQQLLERIRSVLGG